MLKYEYTFNPGEPNSTAAAIAEFALSGGSQVLDIGSGPAWVSRYLAGQHGRSVTCLDYDRAALASLAEAGIQGHWVDLEAEGWSEPVAGRTFDVVILADVLEHLRDPGAVLVELLDKHLLSDEAVLVVSVPNASHESVLSELAVGDFRYTETGILDETHVRWFTPESLNRLLERSGFLVDRTHKTTRVAESVGNPERAARVPAELRALVRTLHDDATTYQVVVRARPRSAALLVAQQRAEIEQGAAERAGLERRAVVAEADLARTATLLERERKAFADALREGAAELDSIRRSTIHGSRLVTLVSRGVRFARRARARLGRLLRR